MIVSAKEQAGGIIMFLFKKRLRESNSPENTEEHTRPEKEPLDQPERIALDVTRPAKERRIAIEKLLSSGVICTHGG